MSEPYTAMDKPMGRNKEISDDFSLRKQAGEAIAKSRKSTKEGAMRPGDYSEGKVVTDPPLTI